LRSLSWRIFGRSLKIFKDLQRSCDDFHQGRYQNVQCFTLEHVHEPKIGLVLFVVVFFLLVWFDCFFLALFLSFFSPLSLMLAFALHILSDSQKSLIVDYVLSPEMEPWLILGVMGHFITNFVPEAVHSFWVIILWKKIPLSRRIGYVRSMDKWVSEWEMYVCHTNQIGSTINSQSYFLL